MSCATECLQYRYKILDELIKDLSNRASANDRLILPAASSPAANTEAVKLMCDMWNALKENPDYDVSQLVLDKIDRRTSSTSVMFKPYHFQCYMACSHNKGLEGSKSGEIFDNGKFACSHERPKEQKLKCCSPKSLPLSLGSDASPLNKALCNLKEAASFDRKCNVRLDELMEAEKQLQAQITHLENREKEAQALLKQADSLWICMDEAYKKKIDESLKRQRTLSDKLTNIEGSLIKWRKRKKDLDLDMTGIDKCNDEIKEKMLSKTNELKFVNNEIEALKKKIENVKKETDSVIKSFSTKKTSANRKMQGVNDNIKKVQNDLTDAKKKKTKKEKEGKSIIREVRDDFTNISKVFFEKQIEEQDLLSEKDGLTEEIELLKDLYKNYDANHKTQKKNLTDEIAIITKEIAKFKLKCTQCHASNDSSDIRKFCADCTRCLQQTDCLSDKIKCYQNPTGDCVCETVKSRFFENVFENMYTVLERQSESDSGKAVADAVLKCLKNSRNGKLDAPTRKVVQEFILSSVKNNLNLTVVGGAIKTRCELDPDSYKQLMLCLQQIKPTPIQKADKAINVKKQACCRWGGSRECNCPKGPSDCICCAKVAKPEQRRTPRPIRTTAEKDVNEVKTDKDQPWTPASCKDHTCTYSKEARTAQCAIEAKDLILEESSGSNVLSEEGTPDAVNSIDDFKGNCICGNSFHEQCPLHSGIQNQMKVVTQANYVAKFNTDAKKFENDNNKVEEYIVIKTVIAKHKPPVPVAFIKPSYNGNFDVTVDKEYENILKTRLNELATGGLPSISLSKTYSNSYLLNFVNTDEYKEKFNAVFVKSLSGELKLIKSKCAESVINSSLIKICNIIILDRNIELENNQLKVRNKNKSKLDCHEPNYIPSIKDKSIGKSKSNDTIKSGEITSEFNQNDSVKLNRYKSVTFVDMKTSKIKRVESSKKYSPVSELFTENVQRDINVLILGRNYKIKTSAVVVKCTGYYSIQFNDSENFKLYKIKTYLSVYEKCYLPVEMDDNNETITIYLDKKQLDTDRISYALLKISSIGKISVILDEDTMVRIYNRTKMLRSFHLICPIENLSNKSDTNTSEYLSEGGCDREKCTCEFLPNESNTCWVQSTKSIHDHNSDINTRNGLDGYTVKNSYCFSDTGTSKCNSMTYASECCSKTRTKSIPDLPLQLPYFLRGCLFNFKQTKL